MVTIYYRVVSRNQLLTEVFFFHSNVSWAFKTDSEEVLLVERVTSKLNLTGDLSDLSVFKR